MSPPIGLHRPGDTWLHRLPAGVKLVALVAAGLVVVVAGGALSALVALGVALVLVAWSVDWSGAGLRRLVGGLRVVLATAALLAAYLAWQHGWQRATGTVADLVALVLLATVVTATTPVDELLDTLTAALRPLRRLGAEPERVALAFALMIRSIPTTLTLAAETRDAARARALDRDPRALLTPLVIRVVAHARATGEALHARGVGD